MNCIFCTDYTDCNLRHCINNPCPDGYEKIEWLGIKYNLSVICGRLPK